MASCSKRCSEKQSGHNEIPGYMLAVTWHTRTYTYTYAYTTNSRLEGGYSRGDMPALMRFGGGPNAVAPIVTSWTACYACGPSSCPSWARGSPGHSYSLWVSPRWRGYLQVSRVSCQLSHHLTPASRVYLHTRPAGIFPHADSQQRRTAFSVCSSGCATPRVCQPCASYHRQ